MGQQDPTTPAMTAAASGDGEQCDFADLDYLGRSAIDTVPVACFLLDELGLFVAGNQSFYDLTSIDRTAYLGHDPYQLLSPAAGAELRAKDNRLYQRGGTISHEGAITAGTGREIPVMYKKTVVHDRHGEKCGILVSVVDLTELAAVKNALHASESEKQAILEGFPGLLCLFDANEKAIWVNAGVRELCEDPVGRSCHEIFCRKNHSCGTCAVPKSLTTGTVQSTIKRLELQTASGEERIYEMTGTPVRNGDNKVTSVVVIGRDVTENHKLEKQLRHTQKMEAIGTLAGGIAHDFNNVLTPIMGYSEILRMQLAKGESQDAALLDYLEGILRAAKRAKGLVEQILTFSRSSEQQESLQYIHPIVKEVMKLMRVTLPSTVVIKEQIDERCGLVSVDPVQIHQVLINLCTNASHAMEGEHGILTVTLAAADPDESGQKWLRLSVADTGCGIRPEMLDRIFEPYFTTKEKSQGTGMGLAMVHGIIKRQGGRIEVVSEVGQGTVFHIYLPVSERTTRIDQVINTSDLVRGSGRILLVDDEAQVVQVTSDLLGSLGYEVTGCITPLLALQTFAENPGSYDLVLTDLTMPDLTGIELCRKLKAIRDDLPVVLFTGYSDQLSQDAAKAAGISQCCTKPLSLRELSRVIHANLTAAGDG